MFSIGQTSPIKEYLRSLPYQERIYFFPNPGNFGDSLIAAATYALFDELGIDYAVVPASEAFDPAGKIIAYGGGGNLVGYYTTARNVIRKYHAGAKKFILLPHTISANEDLLGELGANVDVICREQVSYAHVKKFVRDANVLLMDDLAFSLDMNRLIRESRIRLEKNILPLAVRDFFIGFILPLKQWRGKILEHGDRNTLNTFRNDIESPSTNYPRDNVDLATLFGYGVETEAIAYYVSRRVVKILNQYKIIRTNRLHVCIAGIKLGKQVEFFPNSYYKCEAVYRYSMKSKFPNVRWMG